MLCRQYDDDVTIVITSLKETESDTNWTIVKVRDNIIANCDECYVTLHRVESNLWFPAWEMMRYLNTKDLYSPEYFKELTLVTWRGSYSIDKISKVIESKYQDWLVRKMIEME